MTSIINDIEEIKDLRSQVNIARAIVGSMEITLNAVTYATNSIEGAKKEMDLLARELKAIADLIKEFTSLLKRKNHVLDGPGTEYQARYASNLGPNYNP